jgi:T4-like virus Myoviridae tail sheath stabiliser
MTTDPNTSFFYDKQIRRFINQFVRIFSTFQVEFGLDPNGNTILKRVPVRYADTNRQVSAILRQNSENAMNMAPMMVVYIDAMTYDRDRVQEPNHVNKISIRERGIDPNTGQLTNFQKNAFTIERLMPVPYRLTLKMEVWTTNFEQKLQILEQIIPNFNPALEIQSTDNYIDWTSLSYVLLTDFNWTTRSIPVGPDDPIDVSTLTFELPIWISAPAKLKKLGVVQAVVDSLYDANGNLVDSIVNQNILMGNREYFTPNGYNLIIAEGVARLAMKGPYGNNTDLSVPTFEGQQIAWRPVINTFGEITNGVSLMYLQDELTGRLIVGTISYNPLDPYQLLFTVDPATIPSNTLPPINRIVDPLSQGPGAGLPAAARGQRYLLTNPLGSYQNSSQNAPLAWRNADGTSPVALAQDIIEYDGQAWHKTFDGQNAPLTQYLTNETTGIQYRWTGSRWTKSWEGIYQEGLWSIII